MEGSVGEAKANKMEFILMFGSNLKPKRHFQNVDIVLNVVSKHWELNQYKYGWTNQNYLKLFKLNVLRKVSLECIIIQN